MDDLKEQIETFVEAAQKNHAATSSGEWKVTNREAARAAVAAKALLVSGTPTLDAFAALLKHNDACVRCLAACYLIKYRRSECLWTLRRIRWFDRGILGLTAKYALRRFRDGNLEM
jgi:hypothetical protein